MLVGDIFCTKEDGERLRNLGVKLGEYNDEKGYYENCKVSDRVFLQLDKLWGEIFWALKEGN